MTYQYNNSGNKTLRKKLRNNLGLPEIILWAHIKSSQLGVKFRRQYGVGTYVLDFYCPSHRLGIELDGETHNNEESFNYDVRRQDEIEHQNIKIIRFSNQEIFNNIEGVLVEIKKNLQ